MQKRLVTFSFESRVEIFLKTQMKANLIFLDHKLTILLSRSCSHLLKNYYIRFHTELLVHVHNYHYHYQKTECCKSIFHIKRISFKRVYCSQFEQNQQGSISQSFYEQLLCQLIYAELTGKLRIAYSMKVGRNVWTGKHGEVLLVKLIAQNCEHWCICASRQCVGEIDPCRCKFHQCVYARLLHKQILKVQEAAWLDCLFCVNGICVRTSCS